MWVFFTQLRYQDEFVRFVLVPPFWALAISERRYELQFSADIYVIVLDLTQNAAWLRYSVSR